MGWVVNTIPLQVYPQERLSVPIVQEAEWAPGPDGRMRKVSPPPEFEPRTVQPVASRAVPTTPSRPVSAN